MFFFFNNLIVFNFLHLIYFRFNCIFFWQLRGINSKFLENWIVALMEFNMLFSSNTFNYLDVNNFKNF